MAQKRMFSLKVTDTDKFMDMPTSSQALYFHLGMHGDDDGFVASPKKIARAAGCNEDDLRLLASKGFIIPFESGIIVITDWRINNTLQNDRYHETVYLEEKFMLSIDAAGRYIIGNGLEPGWNQIGSNSEPEPNITKPNPTELNLTEGETAKPPTHPRKPRKFQPPTLQEVTEYVHQRGSNVDPQAFVDFYEARGWMMGKTPMKDWKAACRNAESWERWNRRDRHNEVKDSSDYSRGEDFTT